MGIYNLLKRRERRESARAKNFDIGFNNGRGLKRESGRVFFMGWEKYIHGAK